MGSESTQDMVEGINQIRMRASDLSIKDRPALAAAFARAVTVAAEAGSLVARKGELSLFSAYSRIYPEARFEFITKNEYSYIALQSNDLML